MKAGGRKGVRWLESDFIVLADEPDKRATGFAPYVTV